MKQLVALALLVCTLALIAASPVGASELSPTLEELEAEVMCPTCEAPLNRSHAPAADRIRAFITSRIERGDSKTEIKEQLVLEFGERVLASPSRSGVNTIVWAGVLVYLLIRRSYRARAVRAALSGDGLDPALERRIDDELSRFDRS